MSNVSKVKVQGTVYDIEDSSLRTTVASNTARIIDLENAEIEVDTTLTEAGMAADAAAVGSEISQLKSAIQRGGSFTADVKQALLDIAEHIGLWDDGNADTYIENLRSALFPPANLVSIDAVYTQGGTVYDNQTLDSLKSDLVVTAYYDDSTSAAVTNYTLSGELTTGTSTVTVAYGGKTDTFTVTVTHATAQYTILNSLTNCTNSNSATVVNEETAYTGTLTANSGYIIASVTITMSGTDITSTAYDSSDGSINIASVTGNVVITAEAIEDVGWISGVPYDYTTKSGYLIDNSTGEETADSSRACTDYLPIYGVSYVEWSGTGTPYSSNNAYYTEEKAFDGSFNAQPIRSKTIIPRNKRYVRFTLSGASQHPTITPIKLPVYSEGTIWEADKYYNIPVLSDMSLNRSTGALTPTEGAWCSDYMFCYGASKLNVQTGNSGSASQNKFTYVFYTQDKQFISGGSPSAFSVDIPSSASYVIITVNIGTNNPYIWFTAPTSE